MNMFLLFTFKYISITAAIYSVEILFSYFNFFPLCLFDCILITELQSLQQ